MKYLILSFIIVLFVGCVNNHTEVEQLFSVKKNLYGEVILSEPDVLAPIEVYVTGNSNIFLTEHRNNHFAAILDTQNINKLIRICPIGKGPYEYLPPLFFSRNKGENSVSFFAPRVHKFYDFTLNSEDSTMFKLENEYSGFENANQLVRVNDTLFFSTMANSTITPNRYGIFDKYGELLYSDISYPKNNSEAIFDNLKSIAFQSSLAVNPDNGYVVSACKFVGYMEIMSVGLSGINKISELQTSDGSFDDQSQGKFMSIKPSQKSIITYLCVDACKDYIYLLYSGRTIEKYGKQKAFMGNTILKFNWLGEPIEHLTLDHDIINFSVVDNTLYAIGLDSTPKILKYKIQ